MSNKPILDIDMLEIRLAAIQEHRKHLKREQGRYRQKEHRIKKMINDVLQLNIELHEDDNK